MQLLGQVLFNMITDVLKWTATAVLIIGQFFTALGYYPLGPMIMICGGLLWLIVSIIWKETSLIVTNTIMAIAGIAGLMIGVS